MRGNHPERIFPVDLLKTGFGDGTAQGRIGTGSELIDQKE